MKKLLALVATMVVCAGPALAHGDQPDADCDDHQTTGSLPMRTHGPAAMGLRSARVRVTPPEDSWQQQAQEDAERRRREEAEGCPVN
ncbi:hypothetical protein ACRAWG_15585 [Methylobacterium sp. P31]